jgi:hypothetical protein
VKVIFTEQAYRQAVERRTWWRKHRTHKKAFTEELREARRLLRDAPKLAVHGMREGREVRRLNLSRIHCYLYYTINEAEGVVEIVALWGQEQAERHGAIDED